MSDEQKERAKAEDRKVANQRIEICVKLATTKGDDEFAEFVYFERKPWLEITAQGEGLDESSWWSAADLIEGITLDIKRENCKNTYTNGRNPLHFPRPRGIPKDIPLSEFFSDLSRTIECLSMNLEDNNANEKNKQAVADFLQNLRKLEQTLTTPHRSD